MSDTLFSIPESESKIAASPVKGKPRLVVPNRAQIELRPVDLESLLATDHPARGVWDFIESLDLSPLYAKVESVEGVGARGGGRGAAACPAGPSRGVGRAAAMPGGAGGGTRGPQAPGGDGDRAVPLAASAWATSTPRARSRASARSKSSAASSWR